VFSLCSRCPFSVSGHGGSTAATLLLGEARARWLVSGWYRARKMKVSEERKKKR
jgi:hypothetical protein